MSETPLGPQAARLMAYLYGEMSAGEEAEFRRELEQNDVLRAEYEELREGRDFLAAWPAEEVTPSVPSFVIVGRDEGATESTSPSFWRRLAISPTWGLAVAASLLLVVAIVGFRVERIENGFAVRRAGSDVSAPAERIPEEVPAYGKGRELLMDPSLTATDAVLPASYLTRDEFEDSHARLLQSMVLLLNEIDDQRDADMATLARALYDRVNSDRNYDLQLVNRRIDAIGAELILDRSRQARTFDELLDRAVESTEPRELVAPGSEE